MRIGTRGSALALAQARLVAGWLGEAEIVVVRTRGDIMHEALSGEHELRERSPRDDKSRWVAELEHALLAEEIDLAVHSAKDIPVELARGPRAAGFAESGRRRGRADRRSLARAAARRGVRGHEQRAQSRPAARRPIRPGSG